MTMMQMTDPGIQNQIRAGNDLLIQRNLETVPEFQAPLEKEGLGMMTFFQVPGITRFWDEDEKTSTLELMKQVLTGMARPNAVFALLLTGTAKGVTLRVGAATKDASALENGLRAVFKGIELKYDNLRDLESFKNGFGGVMTGCVSMSHNKENKEEDRLAVLGHAMLGTEFVYMVIARGLHPEMASMAHDRALEKLQEFNAEIRKTVNNGPIGSQIQMVNYAAQEYVTNLRLLEQLINTGCNTGLWRSCTYYCVKNGEDCVRLQNALKMTFGGEDARPQRIRCIRVPNIGQVINEKVLIGNSYPEAYCRTHPLGVWEKEGIKASLYTYILQNIVDTPHLALMSALPNEELPGYYVDDYVSFDTAMRRIPDGRDRMSMGMIMQAGREDRVTVDNQYYFDVSDLNRHGLIIGITGGGKTNTSKYLLGELWREHKKPFLVIESAKREYWELMNLPGFEDLILFTLGSEEQERSISYRINPFEVVGTVSLQTHIDYLLSTFKAAFELYPPMPYVLETSVYEVYEDRGWDIVKNRNTLGLKDYPTLTDLYRKIDVVTDRLGYHQEAKENTKAALKARINSLRIGGKGMMMDTRYSVPIEKLLSTPAVLELEDLGDDDTKAFVIGMVLVQLYEYRKSTHRSGQAKLIHLTMVEEAHRLLKHVPEGGEAANPRAKSVEFFCNLLAEIRSFGQGFLIADQIPTKLAADTLKNTNLKIVHRIVMEEDRKAIGLAMHMNDEQIDYLSALRRGYAAVYAEGDNHPKMIRFPLVENENSKNREEVLQIIRRNVDKIVGEKYQQNYQYHFGCTYCEEQCIWREQVLKMPGIANETIRAKICEMMKQDKFSVNTLNAVVKLAAKPEKPQSFAEKICILGTLIEKCGLSEKDKTVVMARFIRKGAR